LATWLRRWKINQKEIAMNTPEEITRDPHYAKWIEELAKVCTCTPAGERPCDGLLAGGLCDDRHTDERGDQFAE